MLYLLLLLQEAGHSLHGEAFNEGPRQKAYLMPGMGKVDFPTSAKNAEAQAFVAQGVAQLHGFYYFEAERSFRQAAAFEPELAIAYWGMAMANVNNEGRAKGFVEQAVKRREGASKRERMYIDFLQASTKESDKTKRAKAVVKGLEGIVSEFPDDLEALAFLVWACWHYKDKGLPIQSHVAVDALLERLLAKAPAHPGGHHYRIHLWDEEKAERALKSAEAYGPSAPGIAHAWHMPGHIYSKLNRPADAAWQQEAAARVDHAQMLRDAIMPYQIHNYVHNNQWCAKSFGQIGRVADAVAIAENLIEIPRHPKLNKLDDAGHACREGRSKLFEILSQWELWDELLARASTSLAPLEQDRALRARAMGAAMIERGRLDDARALAKELEAVEEKDDKRKKAKEAALAELRARLALAVDDKKGAVEALAKAEDTPKPAKALLYLRAGERAKAEELAKDGSSLWAQAVRAEILKKGDVDAPGADLDLPILKRLGVRPGPSKARDMSIDSLGPLRWSPRAAPDFGLGDFELAAAEGPTVLLFYLGAKCKHCREQLEAFGKLEADFAAAGLRVVTISTDGAEEVERSCESGLVKPGFRALADPEKRIFKLYRCWDDFENVPLHGTFLVDARGRVRWQDISYEPFMDAKFFLEEARRLTK